MVIPFNPCGRIVEWGHHRYKSKCRFFRDDPREDEIEWYPAPAGAKCIEWPSAIYQTIWDRDPDGIIEYHEGVGEVWDAKHETSHAKPVDGTGVGHFCGTREMFENGAEFDPHFHTDYVGILPECCDGPDPGGILWGGQAVNETIALHGIEWGGRAVDGYDFNYTMIVSPTLSFILFGAGTPNPPDLWGSVFSYFLLRGPRETGIESYWTLTSTGGFGPVPAGVWERSGYNGYGLVTFTLLSGGPTPLTIDVRRGDSI